MMDPKGGGKEALHSLFRDTFKAQGPSIWVPDANDLKPFLANAKKAWCSYHFVVIPKRGRPSEEGLVNQILYKAKAEGRIKRNCSQASLISLVDKELEETGNGKLDYGTTRKFVKLWRISEKLRDPSTEPLSMAEISWLREKVRDNYDSIRETAVMHMNYISSSVDNALQNRNLPEILHHLRKVVASLSQVEGPTLKSGYNEAIGYLPSEYSRYQI